MESSRMQAKYRTIARLKGWDALLQMACFIFMAFAMLRQYFWSFVLPAGMQCVSAVVWSVVFAGGLPRQRAGTVIRRIFLVVMWLLLVVAVTREGGPVLIAAYVMLIVGPVCGLSYFIVTIVERRFYGRLAVTHTKEVA